jgi:hypothetical protein
VRVALAGVAICLLAGCSSAGKPSVPSDARISGAMDAIKCSAQSVSRAAGDLAPPPGSSDTASATGVLAIDRQGIASSEAESCMQRRGHTCNGPVCAGIDMSYVVARFLGGR